MKFAAVIRYVDDKAQVKAIHPAHREYLRRLLDGEQLSAAGPLADEKGAVWIFDAETPEHAEDIIRSDPAYAAGVFQSWDIHPLAYCSAKACKGEK